ncbi:MAG: Calx-beta domain-containing protein [Anaerolineae bacterium]
MTVTAVDNFLDDDTRTTTIADGVAGSDPLTRYGDGTVTAASVVVTVLDDDNAGVVVNPTVLTVTENGPAQTYTVVLSSQPFPGETVTISTSGYSATWITVSAATLTFDATNWNVPQTVTVTAVDNFLDDDTRTTTIADGVAGSDPLTRYGDGTVTAASVVVTVMDDDTAGVVVNPTTLTVSEPATAQTYTVVLTSQPFPGETVTVSTSGYSAVWITVSAATLTFDDTNWNVPQTVTVTAVDNFLDDDTRTTTIADGVAGSDPLTRYGDGTVTAASVVVTVLDDDNAGVVVNPTTLTVTENGPAQTYTVVLTSQPFPGETVTISTSGYSATWITVSVATLTFDDTNWNVPQTVTVTAVDNFLDDDTRTTTIADGVAGSNPLTRYGDGTVTAASVVVTVLDNDVAGVTITPTALTVAEPGTSQSYTVVLTSQPFPGETVTISTSGFNAGWITVSAVSLTFDATNWNVPQTVTVTAIDNLYADGTRTTTIADGVAGSNPGTRYGDGTVTAASVVVTITDNDVAGVVASPTTLGLAEPVSSQTYTVVLTSQPLPGETVTITPSGFNAAWISPSAALTFDGTNWNIPQTFTISVIDNLIDEGTHSTTISNVTSSNMGTTPYGNGSVTPATVTVTITNDDVAGVTLDTTPLTVAEPNISQTYTVVLNTQPAAGETVRITPGGFNGAYISTPAFISFTAANWNVPQMVTVTAVDNLIADGTRTTTIANAVSSNSGATPYGSGTVTAGSVDITILDNDIPGVTVNPVNVSVTESSPAQNYNINLNTQPAAGETVTIDLSGFSSEVIVAPTSVTFNAGNWNVARTITVNAVNNFLDDGTRSTTIAHAVSGNNPATPYGNGSVTALPVDVTINDEDVSGVTISPTTLTVTELGAAQTYTVALKAQPFPGETVTISNSGFSAADIAVSPTALIFDNANWNVAQTVTVTAVDNFVADGTRSTTIANSVVGSNPATAYGSSVTAASVVVTVNDNDVAGVTVSTGALTVTEAGAAQTYTLVLTSQPAAGETVTISNGGFSAADITVSPTTLTFDSSNWNVAQTVTVNAVDNLVADGTRGTTIANGVSSSSGTTPYGNGTVTAGSVAVTINDNDVAGSTISPAAVTVTELGAAQTYSVVLTSQPAAGETVTVNLSGFSAETTVSPTTLTFDASNWNVAHSVSVNVVDNFLADGTRSTTINQAVSSNMGTTPYGNGSVTIASVPVTINDNDIPGVALSVNPLDVMENDAPHTYTIALMSQPNPGEVVSITLTSLSVDLTVTPLGPLTFDDTNWNVPQTITVAPIDNVIHDGNRAATIDHAVASTDAASPYGNGTVTAIALPVNITDDDVPGAVFSPRSLQLPEGADGFYLVHLTTQPSGPVSVTLTFDDTQILVNGLVSPVTLTNAWNTTTYRTDITVIVSARSDSLGQGGRTVDITHSFSSTDPDYNFARTFPVTIGDVNADSQSVPRCVMISLEESTIVRAVINQPISHQEVYCRIIVQDREYAEFMGPGNIGNQGVLDMGVIHAVDIFMAPYYEDFTGGLWVCLMGRGDLVYMNQSGNPRQPQLLESMFIDGFTCTTIPNAGTLVLVDPIDYSTFTQTPATCDIVTAAEVNLRQGATTASRILQVLPYDMTLHVNAMANGWYRVEVDGVTGWVNANWVREVTSCTPPSQ